MATNELTAYMQGRTAKGFNARPFYSKEGDCLTYFFRDEDYVADRIDDILTVYRSGQDDGDIVGFKLKSINCLLTTLAEFGGIQTHQYTEGNLTLGLLFMAGAWVTDCTQAVDQYRKLGKDRGSVQVRRQVLEEAFAAAGY